MTVHWQNDDGTRSPATINEPCRHGNLPHRCDACYGEATGSERIRLAVIRDRGGDAPTLPAALCGDDPTGALTVRDWDALASARSRDRTPLSERLAYLVMCPACLRLRINPAHWWTCA